MDGPLLVPWYENTKSFAPNIDLTIVGWLSTIRLCLILTVWPKPYIWCSRIAEELLSWVDWLMCDSIKWLVLTFSGFVQLSKMWWGTKTCWLNDWSDWLRRGGGELWGSEDVGELDIDWKWSNIFVVWWNWRFLNLLRFQPGRTVACECDWKLSLVHLDFLILQLHLRPCQRSRSVSVPWCCNRCQAYH